MLSKQIDLFTQQVRTITPTPKEIWEPVYLWESYYEISNMGRLRTKERYLECWINGKKYLRLHRSKEIATNHRKRYKNVTLSGDGMTQYTSIHRLVAEAFIPNPTKKPFVNHINGNKHDNRLSNLEWATESENSQHAYDTGLMNDKHLGEYQYKKGQISKNRKIVLDVSMGIFYDSVDEAAKATIWSASHLASMLRGVFRNRTSMLFA